MAKTNWTEGVLARDYKREQGIVAFFPCKGRNWVAMDRRHGNGKWYWRAFAKKCMAYEWTAKEFLSIYPARHLPEYGTASLVDIEL